MESQETEALSLKKSHLCPAPGVCSPQVCSRQIQVGPGPWVGVTQWETFLPPVGLTTKFT